MSSGGELERIIVRRRREENWTKSKVTLKLMRSSKLERNSPCSPSSASDQPLQKVVRSLRALQSRRRVLPIVAQFVTINTFEITIWITVYSIPKPSMRYQSSCLVRSIETNCSQVCASALVARSFARRPSE